MAAEFKFLNSRGFTATQSHILWFALSVIGKVFGAIFICFALYLSLFPSLFDSGDLVVPNGAQFSVGLFASLFLVSGLASSTLFLAIGATFALCCHLTTQEFAFAGGIGFFGIGLAVAFLPFDFSTLFGRRAQVFPQVFPHSWQNTLIVYFGAVSKWGAQVGSSLLGIIHMRLPTTRNFNSRTAKGFSCVILFAGCLFSRSSYAGSFNSFNLTLVKIIKFPSSVYRYNSMQFNFWFPISSWGLSFGLQCRKSYIILLVLAVCLFLE